MEDGHQSSQTSATFDLIWNTLTANDGETHLQNEVSFSTTENGQMYNSLDFQVDGIDIPNFLAFPSQPQTFRPSIDSGAPPSEMSEMTTSPGALSIQSPPPQDGLTCQNGPTPHNDPAYQNNGPVQNGAASQVLPSNTVWTGDYDFNYSLETCGEHAEKSISWTYSPTLGKLFVDREKNCPINFRTSKQPPPETVLRVLPIFQKSGSIQEVVKRCPHHMGQGVDHSAHHIVICQDPSASYETDPTTGRHSLVLPFQKPQAGNSSLQFLFTFKCFMSCVGGLNRRPIQLIFTLENRGQIIGRQVLDTRICACPGRDRKSEEKNREKPKKGTKRSKQVTQTVAITSLKKKKKTEPKDTEIFLLRVEGRQRYETLVKLNEALDLFDMATPEQKAEQKARQDKIKKILEQRNSRNK